MILNVSMILATLMYLIDTNVLSEIRKKKKADAGVLAFFKNDNKKQRKLISVRNNAPLTMNMHSTNKLQQQQLFTIWLWSLEMKKTL